jgi:hypothetical protein
VSKEALAHVIEPVFEAQCPSSSGTLGSFAWFEFPSRTVLAPAVDCACWCLWVGAMCLDVIRLC